MLNKDFICSELYKMLPMSVKLKKAESTKPKQVITTNIHSCDNMMIHTHLSLYICPQSSTSNHSYLTARAPPKEKHNQKKKFSIQKDFH